MNMKTPMKYTTLAALALSGSMMAPLFASAQNVTMPAPGAAPAPTSVAAPAPVAPATATPKMLAAIAKADKEIDRRIAALNELQTRVDAMQRVTANFKQTLSTNIGNQITGLTQLKTKIDADTDAATLKTDIKTVTDSYRVYMLVLPQARIAASADREVTLITMMNQLGGKLQARVAAAQSAGADVSKLLAALTDMSTKLSDANTQSQASVSVSANLMPDNGDATKQAQNTAALKTAKGDLDAAQKDLVAARKDVDIIVKGLKSLPTPTVNSTSTPSASGATAPAAGTQTPAATQ